MIKNLTTINQLLAIGFCIGFGFNIGCAISKKVFSKFDNK